MNRHERNFVCVLIVAALLPFLSWVLSALGVPCRSLLDDEGLRWLYSHASDSLRGFLVTFALCCVIMQGVINRCGILPLSRTFRDRRFYRLAFVYAVILIGFLLAAVLTPNSPFLSITGSVADSPLLHGLPFLGWFSFIVFCLCYGHPRCKRWTRMLTYGLRRNPLALPFAVAVSFCWQCIKYMIG